MMMGYRTVRVGIVALAAAGAAACAGGEAKDAAEQQSAAEASPGVLVETEAVEARPFTEHIRLVGGIEAERSVTVAAEESGVVRALLVPKGAFVDAGDPLVRIDGRLLRAEFERAEAEAGLARENYERQLRLWEQDSVGTEMAVIEARYRADQARANLDHVAARLERTTVRAPIAGVLDARQVEVGSMLAPGTPVARVVDLDTVKVTAGVPERYANEVRRGTAATVTFDVIQGETFEGEIEFVGSVVSDQNRTFPIEVAVPNERGMIKPGMVANVRIVRRTMDQAVLVPQEAVLRTDAGYLVYVVAERGGDRIAQARTVRLGVSDRDRVLVESGLEAGDRVIVVGQKQVTDGVAVRLVDAPSEAGGIDR